MCEKNTVRKEYKIFLPEFAALKNNEKHKNMKLQSRKKLKNCINGAFIYFLPRIVRKLNKRWLSNRAPTSELVELLKRAILNSYYSISSYHKNYLFCVSLCLFLATRFYFFFLRQFRKIPKTKFFANILDQTPRSSYALLFLTNWRWIGQINLKLLSTLHWSMLNTNAFTDSEHPRPRQIK